ncbi:MAG: insulinase family protein [Deltaproteobacteria bacterium]|nr:insulinase family protein [Deltaproteobacteria bacterium]
MLETTLKNGLRVIVEENHASKVVAAQVWVRVGSADERPEEAGIAHVHEHMLFKGTERRKVGEIAADVEAAGGDINAWTSFDQTVYHVTIASRELPVALDILADAVQHSSFDSDELGRELEVVLEELRRGNDTPSRVASEMLFRAAYDAHPYFRPVIGYVDTVKSFTRSMIVDFYKRWYQPRNMCLVVVGDVSADDVVARAEKLFESDRNAGALPDRVRAKEPVQAGLRSVVKSQDIQETHLGVAWHGTNLADEDTPALDVLSILLGTGESSRLFRRLKRERELVNDCYAYSYTPQDPGLLVVGAQIHGEKIEEAFTALLEETWRLCYEEPERAELDKAKTIILSDAVYQKETVQGIARKIGYFELVAGSVAFEDLYYAKVKEVTPEDVKRVAKKYLRPEAFSVATLLPTAHEGQMTEAKVQAIAKAVHAKLEAEHERPRFTLGALQVAKTKLSNGATLLVREDRGVPIVSIRAAATGGLLAEQPSDNGISQLVGELVCRGTEKYSAEQIIEETDAMAGGISGQAGRNSLGLRGEFLRDSWERGFELFSSCLLEPAFPVLEIEKERKNQLEDIAARQDNLSAIAFDRFAEALYGQHPYAMPTQGTAESVKGLTREQLVSAFHSQLAPDRLTISVVGAVDVDRTIKLIESRIGTRQRHVDARTIVRPAVPVAPTAPKDAHYAKEKEQAHLVLGFLGVAMNDERRYALEVLSSVLGGQSGRLFLELRDKQSLAYSVSAFSLDGLDPGYFAVYIGTSNDKVDTAERGMRAELEKILETEVTAPELSRAQRYLIGAHEISLQRMSARAATMALNECYGFGYDAHARYADRIAGVTSQQIREVARQIIRFDRVVRSVVAAR